MKDNEEYESEYQTLLKNGFLGWGKERTVDQLLNFSLRQDLERVLATQSWGFCPRALELGCGTGAASLYLASQGLDALGIDVSRTAVNKARELAALLHLPARFIWGDFLTSLLPHGRFHLVIDSSFLDCIVSEEERAHCLARIHGLLEVDGFFILHTLVDGECAPSTAAEWTGPKRLILPPDVIRGQLSAGGFQEVEHRIRLEGNKRILFGVYSK